MKYTLLLFIIFSSCGIEVPQPIPRLYSPNGAQAKNVLSLSGVPEATVQITWYGLNPELEFSGYNIYYTDDFAKATAYQGTKILCRAFNPKQATKPIFPPFNVARSFSFDIHKFYYANQGELFTQGKQYWFYVTAYNQVRNIESPPSLITYVLFKDNIP